MTKKYTFSRSEEYTWYTQQYTSEYTWYTQQYTSEYTWYTHAVLPSILHYTHTAVYGTYTDGVCMCITGSVYQCKTVV